MSNVSDIKLKYRRWMGDLPETLTHTCSLSELAIPGSHCSFSFGLDVDGGVGPDQSNMVKSLGQLFPGAGCSIVKKWSVTQHLDFREQLECGIRYFDLRVCIREGAENEFRFLHGLYGPNVIPCMEVIKQFLEENDREIVILDFNHFYNMNDIAHEQLLTKMKEVFKDKLILVDSKFEPGTATLYSLWKTEMRVYVFYHNNAINRVDGFGWPGCKIPSLWSETNDLEALIGCMEDCYQNGRRKPDGSFFVWQGVLTPTTNDIVFNLFTGSLESAFSLRSTAAFVRWVEGKLPDLMGINVCASDFVESCDFIPTVIKLNHKKESGD